MMSLYLSAHAPREIIICGSVLARFEAGRQMRRQRYRSNARPGPYKMRSGFAIAAFVGSRIAPS